MGGGGGRRKEGIHKPPFEPRNGSPTIEATVRRGGIGGDGRVLYNQLNKQEDPAITTGPAAVDGRDLAVPEGVGGTVTTVEYDVVACEDFFEDEGKWIRFMPKEIRDANPDFVPT